MTIIIGAAQKEYSIVMADTQASRGSEKLFYPSKLMVRPTAQGTEVLGFSGIVPFWEFFRAKDRAQDVRDSYLSVDQYLAVRREFRKVSTFGSLSSRSRYTRVSSIISVRAQDLFPLREFTGKGIKVAETYVASGNGSTVAFETLEDIAPHNVWSKMNRAESMLALLHAYNRSIKSVIGCGGVPSIYVISKEGASPVDYSASILMQRIEQGFNGGLLPAKLAKSGIEHLLDGEDHRLVQGLILSHVKGGTAKIHRVQDLLDGFMPERV